MRKIEIRLDINKYSDIIEVEDDWTAEDIEGAAFNVLHEKMISWTYDEVNEDGSRIV